jgi:MFS family permease
VVAVSLKKKSVTAARFIARLGGEAAFFIGVWGLAAYEFDANPTQIAILMAVLAVTSMIGAAVAGSLVDRFGPRTVLVGAQFFYVPVVLATAFVGSLEQLVGMCALLGLATAPIMTASGSFAPYLTSDPERIEKVNALFEGAGALSFVMGPALGALVATTFSIPTVLFVDAALTTIGAVLVLPVSTPPVAGEAHHPLKEIAEGLRVTYRLRGVRYYVLMGTLMWFSFGAFGALEPLFFRDVVKTGVETIGYMNSLFGAGIAAGAWALTRLPSKATTARGLAVGVAMMGVCAAIYVGTTNLWVIGAGALVWGAVIGATEPLLRTLMQIDAPEEYVGRVMGTAQVHRSAGEIVPLALAPGLAAAFGVQTVMIAGAVLAAVISLATLPHAASIDRAGRQSRQVRLDEAFATDDPISPLA